jgi:hypothetical protein
VLANGPRHAAGRRSSRSSVSAQWWLCLSRNPRLRHDRSTIRRRSEEAAGVEAQFEATQSTETPLEFFLRKRRDTTAAPADRSRQPRRLRHSAIRSCRQWLTGFVTGTATMGALATLRDSPVTKSGGRPPIGEKTMTGVLIRERSRPLLSLY